VTKDWKFVKRLFVEPKELYHLKSDPGEFHNVYGEPEYQETVRRLNAKLDEFFARYADEKYDPWRGGTGKAVLMYSDKNERFIAEFPNWQPPMVEELTPLSDLRPVPVVLR
jgi:hypothetical protein